MLRKLFALSYLQVYQPIKIRDRNELNDNEGYFAVFRNQRDCILSFIFLLSGLVFI